ncbi:MAG TPA: hypothetical protein G4O03_08000 [Dehalococcoidia bacterium]|nr:hypothetical protein [Dehalococcoidia bacterium]
MANHRHALDVNGLNPMDLMQNSLQAGEVIQSIPKILVGILGANVASLYLLDRAGGTFRLEAVASPHGGRFLDRAQRALGGKLMGCTVPASKGQSRAMDAVLDGRVWVGHDPREFMGGLVPERTALARVIGGRTIIALPLLGGAGVLGAMHVALESDGVSQSS